MFFTKNYGKMLIIFTRYPEAGKTKTRLIAALGASGAASLQQQMSEHTLKEAKKLVSSQLTIEIHFAGGNQELMQQWLGPDDLLYKQQKGDDLGKKIALAFEQAFNDGMTKVVVIGTDCPDLNASLINEAFEALNEYQLVIGPAYDGGYYLIGLVCLVRELFENIHWGSAKVLAQTEEIAEKLGINIYYLKKLQDVDLPQDLPVWEKYLNETT